MPAYRVQPAHVAKIGAALMAVFMLAAKTQAAGGDAYDLAAQARNKFRKLSTCEEKILRVVQSGEFAYCGPSKSDDDPANDPANGERWKRKRVVRAALLRWLCVNPEASKHIDPRGIQVHGARIHGALDVSFAAVPFPLWFRRCYLDAPLSLQFAKIPLVNLAASRVSSLNADGVKVSGDVFLKDGFHTDGEVRLLGADIGGDLDCRAGTFANKGGFTLDADGIKVSGTVLLNDGFHADGEVRLPAGNISGNLDCGAGTFANKGRSALVADGIKVSGTVLLNDGFHADGEVRLSGADITGNLVCDGGTFANKGGNALSADGIRVSGDVSLAGEFHADGAVRLGVANIEGLLDVEGAEFEDRATVMGQGATVKGPLFWQKLGPNSPVTLDLRGARVGPILDDEESWPGRGRLFLDGFVYERIGEGPTDAAKRLEWLARQPDGFKPQPYEQLARVLREAGDDAGARRVLVEMENQRRQFGNLGWLRWLWQWVLRVTIGYGYRPWYALLWAFGIVLLGCLLFRHGYNAGAVAPMEKDAYTDFESSPRAATPGHAPAYYQPFNAFIYSADCFLPIINFRQKDYWMPNPNRGALGVVLRVYLWIHIALGWLLTTLFVAGFTPIVRSG